MDSEEDFFNAVKACFENQDKDTVIEYLATLLSKLVFNGVSIEMELEPQYIEYGDENGILQRVFARYSENPIRDSMVVDFSKHDEGVRNELGREFLKNAPSPARVSP